jgi:WD40 repeat protein
VFFPEASFAFFPDGRRLATQHAAGWNNIAVWDLVKGTSRHSPEQETGRDIRALTISPNAQLIATGDLAGSIQLHDAETLASRIKLFGHRTWVISLAFSPDSRRLASGDAQGAVKLWDVETGEELLELEGLAGNVQFLQFAPDGLTLYGATPDGGGRFVVWHGQAHQSEPEDRPR